MKHVALFFGSLLVFAALVSCSVILQVTVFNNTGGTIEVYTEHSTGKIEPGMYDDYHYPSRAGEAGVFQLLRIAGGQCEYLYDLDGVHYPDAESDRGEKTADRGVQVQVEKDFSIDLLPADYVGKGPAPSEMIPKREGFPLRPFTKKCR